MVDAQVARDGRGINVRRAGVRNAVVVGVVVLSGLLAGETGAAFRNLDGVAVIIGNRAYKYDVPQVTYAHRDAEAFRRYVVDVLGFDPENVIHKKDADKATMERVFGNRESLKGSELWRHLHPDGISDVVVFYSGHGIPGLNDKRGYLLPVNAHPDTAELNGYPIDVLYTNLVKLKDRKDVRSVHVFLDACFSGDSGGGMLIGSTSAIRVAPLQASEGLEKLTILTAASGREVASWDKAAKHGLFTHHLLNALYGAGDVDADSQVTAAEVKAHLDRHMTRAARREFGRVQNAELRGVETAVLARAVGGMFPVRPVIGPVAKPNPVRRTPDDTKAPDPATERLFWESIKDSEDSVAFAAYLKQYPDGVYADLARQRQEERLRLKPADLQSIQLGLEAAGFTMGSRNRPFEQWMDEARRLNPGVPDERLQSFWQKKYGAFDRRTRASIERWQASQGRRATGYLDEDSAATLRAAGWRRADDEAYARAEASGTVEAYEAYIAAYPAGEHVAQAWQRVEIENKYADLRTDKEAALLLRLQQLEAEGYPAGGRFRDCPSCPEMVVVPAGSYEMGSPASEARRNENEGPVHRVTIAEPLAVGVYEVTRGEFGRFVEATGYSAGSCWMFENGEAKKRSGSSWRTLAFQQTDQHPVVCVNWEDAQAYVQWLSQETGQAYRLLSEAEWEYVARAGTRTARYWGQNSSEQCRYANGEDMAVKRAGGDGSHETVDCNDGYVVTSLVGMYGANPFGLRDVLGNVLEWVQDCWNESYSGAPSDGRAWESGDCDMRVSRGGSWASEPRDLRSASRGRVDTGFRVIVAGFRVARTLTGTSAVPRGVVQQQEAEARQQAEETREKAESRKSLLASLIKQQMVHVEGGAFTMGCTKEQSSCLITEKPVHRVRVRSFEISKYEVTQTLWEAVLGENPSRFDNCALCPVEKVSWKDIQTFLKKLNNLTGERYRLPTEAEWEYAARGGQQSRGYKYAGSNEPGLVAWYDKNSGDETHPVGQKAANELGLYDMSGNLWEWVQDCWHHSYAGAPSDGEAWQSGNCSRRVVRGGSWLYDPRNIRSAVRYEGDAEYRSDSFGFRVARTLTDSAAMPQAADQQHEDEALQLALESIQKWEFKSSIEIENPDLQSSGCADTSVTDSSGRSLKDIADQWGYDPEEVYAFGLKIQDAVRERDLAKFFSLVDGELDYGPRRKYAENKTFHEVFPDSWRTAILNDEPPCTPVGWRGFMLANGLVKYKAPSEDSDTFRLVAVHDWVPEKFPPVPVGWKVDDRLLPPTCFEYKSDSGDNFEAFAEQFSIADYGDFSHNTGKYFGDPIYPFKDNTAGNIWRYVGDCARDMAPDQLQISDSRVEYVYPSGGERLRYRSLADVSPNLCQNLAPNLPGKCLESYLVDVDYCGGSMGCRGSYTIYGMFQMQDSERIIFPLKNFDTENLARNFLDSK